MATCALVAAGFAAHLLPRAAVVTNTGRASGTACSVADAIFVAAAISQAALIVLAAVSPAGQGVRAARTGQAGRAGLTAGIAAGVGLGAACGSNAGMPYAAAGIATDRVCRAAAIARAAL